MKEKRPKIERIKSGEELRKWYWLKQELVDYCKLKKISYVGGKFEILDRIADFLNHEADSTRNTGRKQIKSKLNWSKETLSLDTVITDSYKNSQNVRSFFEKHCGDKFRFNIAFMNWMKSNFGKTLKDAIVEWERIATSSRDKKFKSEIPKHNQYNQYIRDFFADNPDKTIKEARHFWKLKKQLPIMYHKYERSDLDLK